MQVQLLRRTNRMVAVSAVKTLKNGKVSEKNFNSIASAAKWVAKNEKSTSASTAATNICNASLRRESRMYEEPRKTAYGYEWKR